MTPRVALVGAGPGDPELLTVKAVRALRRATVVLVDDLVGGGVLRYVRQSARVVHVGKRGGCTSTPQSFIEKLMIAEAQRGERVVRLKGGDPFVFGRGGEEGDALRAAGIDVEVVTLVIYMGVSRVQHLVEALQQGGLASATPAAVVSAAHTPQQRHALCCLDTLAETLARESLPSPAILVIGDVVRAAPMWEAMQEDYKSISAPRCRSHSMRSTIFFS